MDAIGSLTERLLQFWLHKDILKTYGSGIGDPGTFAGSPGFGGDQDYPVSSSRAVKGRGSASFQDRHRGYILWVKVSQAVTHIGAWVPEVIVGRSCEVGQWNTVHNDKGLVVSG